MTPLLQPFGFHGKKGSPFPLSEPVKTNIAFATNENERPHMNENEDVANKNWLVE